MIRDLIPYELGGAVDYVLAREGARCRLEIPAKWLTPTLEHAVLSKELTRGRMPRRDAVSLRAACADGRHSKLLLKLVIVRTLVVKDAPSSS